MEILRNLHKNPHGLETVIGTQVLQQIFYFRFPSAAKNIQTESFDSGSQFKLINGTRYAYAAAHGSAVKAEKNVAFCELTAEEFSSDLYRFHEKIRIFLKKNVIVKFFNRASCPYLQDEKLVLLRK